MRTAHHIYILFAQNLSAILPRKPPRRFLYIDGGPIYGSQINPHCRRPVPVSSPAGRQGRPYPKSSRAHAPPFGFFVIETINKTRKIALANSILFRVRQIYPRKQSGKQTVNRFQRRHVQYRLPRLLQIPCV